MITVTATDPLVRITFDSLSEAAAFAAQYLASYCDDIYFNGVKVN